MVPSPHSQPQSPRSHTRRCVPVSSGVFHISHPRHCVLVSSAVFQAPQFLLQSHLPIPRYHGSSSSTMFPSSEPCCHPQEPCSHPQTPCFHVQCHIPVHKHRVSIPRHCVSVSSTAFPSSSTMVPSPEPHSHSQIPWFHLQSHVPILKRCVPVSSTMFQSPVQCSSLQSHIPNSRHRVPVPKHCSHPWAPQSLLHSLLPSPGASGNILSPEGAARWGSGSSPESEAQDRRKRPQAAPGEV